MLFGEEVGVSARPLCGLVVAIKVGPETRLVFLVFDWFLQRVEFCPGKPATETGGVEKLENREHTTFSCNSGSFSRISRFS